MNYEITTMEAKTVVGLKTRTNNMAPDMGQKIGALWARLFSGAYQTINAKVNEKSIGLYTNYASDHTQDYDLYVGCEVSSVDHVPDEMGITSIPAGRYAKFVVKGNEQDILKAIAACWGAIWSMDLPRSYTGDYEEYQPEDDKGSREVHIYIALK